MLDDDMSEMVLAASNCCRFVLSAMNSFQQGCELTLHTPTDERILSSLRQSYASRCGDIMSKDT